MRKFLFIYSIVAIVVVSCNNNNGQQADAMEANIHQSADSMMAAFKRRDYDKYATYIHPTMIKMIGGPKAFTSFVTRQMQQLPDTAIKKLEAGKILQVVKTPNDEQCVVEQNMEMHVEGTKILYTTYLVGQSLDHGKSWTFFDASTKALPPTTIKPDLSSQLKIPDTKKQMEQL